MTMITYRPDEYDIAILAKHYLRLFIEKDIHGFLTGHCSGSSLVTCATKFWELHDLLDKESARSALNDIEQEFRSIHGDEWEAYKCTLCENLFPGGHDTCAIVRLVEQLPKLDVADDEYWNNVGNVYSHDYAKVLRHHEHEDFTELMKAFDKLGDLNA